MAKKHISLWLDEDVLKKIDANIKVSKLNTADCKFIKKQFEQATKTNTVSNADAETA